MYLIERVKGICTKKGKRFGKIITQKCWFCLNLAWKWKCSIIYIKRRSICDKLVFIVETDFSISVFEAFFLPNNQLFSLRRGDLIRRSCWSVRPSVRPSVIDFLIFQKRGFESMISDLSNTTKLKLLESLLPKVTAIVRLPNPKLITVVWLPHPKFKTMGAGDTFLRIQNLFICKRAIWNEFNATCPFSNVENISQHEDL